MLNIVASRWLVALAICAGLAWPQHAEAADADAGRVYARVSGNSVYVEFAADPAALRQIDGRLTGGSHVMVTWMVDLRRVTKNWRDPRIAHATIQVTVTVTDDGLFEVQRRFKGEEYGPTRVVDRDTAYGLLSSFRLPMFETNVPRGTYEVVVRATVSGGGAPQVTTPILARADVEP